jgi:hypothetical protein
MLQLHTLKKNFPYLSSKKHRNVGTLYTNSIKGQFYLEKLPSSDVFQLLASIRLIAVQLDKSNPSGLGAT